MKKEYKVANAFFVSGSFDNGPWKFHGPIPVLPDIKKNVHINQFQVGILITAFSVPAGIVIPFAGILSDQIGRKKSWHQPLYYMALVVSLQV